MNKPSIIKIIATVWIVFSILYIGYNQYTYLVGFIAQKSYEKGLSDAVTSVISQSQKCEAFQVYVGNNKVQLINAACVQKNTAEKPTSTKK